MARDYETLTAEIDRVVTSPYPTQLKTLRDLLQSDCASSNIARWALTKPCQVERLVSCVLEGLRQWPYVLDIVEKLCSTTTARDAFLTQEPRLLHDIIIQALRNDDTHSPYATAAISMLLQPLPHRIAMPADTQSLFVRTFDRVAHDPCVATVKPAYQLLQGSAANLLSLLSSRVLVKIEDQIFEILRTTRGDDSAKILYCLAILRVMLASSEDDFRSSVNSYDTQELLASTQLTSSRWTPESVRQFFDGEKAQKTIQLSVLRVMWACNPTAYEMLDEKLESLRLANEILSAVAEENKATWRKANALIVRKLEDKVTAAELDPSSRYQALCFLLQLTKGGFTPALIADYLRQLIVKPTSIQEVTCFGRLSHLQLLASCGVLDQSTTRALLQNAVDFATSATREDLVTMSKPLESLFAQFTESMTHEESITEGIMLALDVLSCGNKLHHMARQLEVTNDNSSNSTSTSVCGQAAQAAFRRLVHGLCKVFLLALLSSHQSSYALPPWMRPLLLDLHAASAQRSHPCSHAPQFNARELTTFPFVEAESTPCDRQSGWRDALATHFGSRSRAEHQSISAIFCQATSELEARCEGIEKPLQEERSARQGLQNQYDELTSAYAVLESESIDRSFRLDALEAEKEQCVHELEVANAEVDGTRQSLRRAEEELRDSKSGLNRRLEEAAGARDGLELRHAAALAKKEEEFEDFGEQLRAAADEARIKTDEIADLKRESDSAKAALDDSMKAIGRLELLSSERQAAVERLHAALEEAKAVQARVEDQLSDMQEQLRQNAAAHSVELDERKECLKREMQDRLDSKGREIEDLIAYHDELRKTLEKAHVDVDQLHRTGEQQTAKLAKRERKNADLQKEVNRLQRKCEQKDQQIAEANAMRTNLMAAMGINNLQQVPPASLPYRPSRYSATQAREHDQDTQDDPSPPTPFSGDDFDAEQSQLQASFGSAASSSESRNGPTPKRAKPRPSVSVKSRTPAKARPSTASTRSTRSSLHGWTSARRQPLANMNTNPTDRKSLGTQTPTKSVLDNLDESTFDGSEVFGGTQGGGTLDLQGVQNG